MNRNKHNLDILSLDKMIAGIHNGTANAGQFFMNTAERSASSRNGYYRVWVCLPEDQREFVIDNHNHTCVSLYLKAQDG